MHFIYLITNLINQKIYIGQTNNLNRRWHQHKSSAKCGDNTLVITRAMIKYGIDNFIFEEIALYETQEEVDIAEMQFINEFNSLNPDKGYNVDIGGNSNPRTPEIIKKISDGLLEHYKTHPGTNKGKKFSNEWKQNMSKSAMGKPGTNKGKKFPEEWRSKISAALSGKEYKERRKFSEEMEKEICRLYIEDKISSYRLAINLNCRRNIILGILKRYNVKIRKQFRFSKEIEKEICDKFLYEKLSRYKLSIFYECCSATIREVLSRNNINCFYIIFDEIGNDNNLDLNLNINL